MQNTIQAAVHAATQTLIESGAIEKRIEEALEKTISSAIKSELESYSKFGQSIKDKVAQALAVNFDDLTLPSYGESILAVVSNIVKARAEASIAEHVQGRLEELLANPEREISLSTLVDRWCQHVADKRGYSHDRPENVGLFIDRDGSLSSFLQIYLHENCRASTREKYSWPIMIHAMKREQGKWEMIGLRINGRDAERDPMFALGCTKFERSLYSMFASGTKLEIGDDDDIDTTIHYDDRED